MTREEQIEKAWLAFAVQSIYRYDEKSVKDAIKWADEHPNLYNDEKYHTFKVSCLDKLYRKSELYDTLLEKACEYLKTHLWQNVDDDNDPIIESVQNITLDNFIKNFKKYLEE